ncbi:MAG TPA: hypothetical protein VKA37_07115 [Halobacteriales archaeon]|nr:hypothetical protein [Halobacteriales archaeon]
MAEDTHATLELPPTELLATLADARRRRALRSLNRASPRALAALARDVAEMEAAAGGGTDADAAAATHRVELDLYHCQVPALDDAGLVRYDAEAGSVAVTPRGTAVDDWLHRQTAVGRPVGCD